jgi:hypothetical protein
MHIGHDCDSNILFDNPKQKLSLYHRVSDSTTANNLCSHSPKSPAGWSRKAWQTTPGPETGRESAIWGAPPDLSRLFKLARIRAVADARSAARYPGYTRCQSGTATNQRM